MLRCLSHPHASKLASIDSLKGLIESKGALHLSELTGQTIPVVMRISLLIKTTQPDMLNPK